MHIFSFHSPKQILGWILKWGALSRWSFRPIFAWSSIETTIISRTHHTLFGSGHLKVENVKSNFGEEKLSIRGLICSEAPSSAQSYKWRDKWFLPLQGLWHDYDKASHDAFYIPGYNFGCYSTSRFDKHTDYHKRYRQGNACDCFYMTQTLSVRAICRDINPTCPVNFVAQKFSNQNSIFHLAGDFPRWEKSLAMAKSHQVGSWILLVIISEADWLISRLTTVNRTGKDQNVIFDGFHTG